jgi:hypothetical protein
MANKRYSANHTVGADTPRPSPSSGSSKGGSWNERTANWTTDIGPRGPRLNKVGFTEVKAYPVYHLNDDPADPSVFMPGSLMPTTDGGVNPAVGHGAMLPPSGLSLTGIGNGGHITPQSDLMPSLGLGGIGSGASITPQSDLMPPLTMGAPMDAPMAIGPRRQRRMAKREARQARRAAKRGLY